MIISLNEKYIEIVGYLTRKVIYTKHCCVIGSASFWHAKLNELIVSRSRVGCQKHGSTNNKHLLTYLVSSSSPSSPLPAIQPTARNGKGQVLGVTWNQARVS
jgi:hypothetical protein